MTLAVQIQTVPYRSGHRIGGQYLTPVVSVAEVGGWDGGQEQVAFASMLEALLYILAKGASVWFREVLTVEADGETRQVESELVLHRSRDGKVSVGIWGPGIRGEAGRTCLTPDAAELLPSNFGVRSDGAEQLHLELDLPIEPLDG